MSFAAERSYDVPSALDALGQMLSEVMDRLDAIDKRLDDMKKQLDELRVGGLAMPERIRKHLDDSAMLAAGCGGRR